MAYKNKDGTINPAYLGGQFALPAGYSADGTPPAPAPVITPPADGSATPATAYKGLNVGAADPADAALARATALAGSAATSKVDEGRIYQQKLNQYQAEIDATNKIYADQLSRQATINQGNLGSGRAIQARSGVLGSDFGVAQTAKINDAGEESNRAIQAAQAAAIGAILGTARQDAATEYQAKVAAQSKGLSDYITYLGQQSTRRDANTKKLAASILDQGLTLDQIDPSQLSEIAKSYGLTPADIKEGFAAEKKVRDDAKAKADAQAVKDNSFNLSEGQSYYKYNTETGGYDLVASKAKTYAPDAGTDPNGLLSIADAKTLGVPYGTTNAQAIAMGKTPGVAAANGQATSAILTTIDDLMASNTNAITGIQDPRVLLPGTEAQKTKNLYDQLQGMLSLKNRDQLKGSGAISDFEFKVLQQAASSLGTNLSNEDFKRTLAHIKSQLIAGQAAGGQAAQPAASGVSVTTPDGSTFSFPDQAAADAFKVSAGIP